MGWRTVAQTLRVTGVAWFSLCSPTEVRTGVNCIRAIVCHTNVCKCLTGVIMHTVNIVDMPSSMGVKSAGASTESNEVLGTACQFAITS